MNQPVGRDSVEPTLPPQAVRAQRVLLCPGFWKTLPAFASLRSKAGSTESRPTGREMGILSALPMNLKVGRVAPRAPFRDVESGTRGATRPTTLSRFKSSTCEFSFRHFPILS